MHVYFDLEVIKCAPFLLFSEHAGISFFGYHPPERTFFVLLGPISWLHILPWGQI